MKKHISQTGVFIALFVSIVIAVIAIGAIVTQITSQSSTTTVTDDQFVVANNTCVDVTSNCILSITSVENATASGAGYVLGAANYSLCNANAPRSRYDGIRLATKGTVNIFDGDTINATYVGADCSYISSGTSRNLIAYIPILLVIILLIGVVATGGLSKT